jgi:hypothetical protein
MQVAKKLVVWKVWYIYISCANLTFLGVMGSFQDYLSILCPKQLGSYFNLQAMKMMNVSFVTQLPFPKLNWCKTPKPQQNPKKAMCNTILTMDAH